MSPVAILVHLVHSLSHDFPAQSAGCGNSAGLQCLAWRQGHLDKFDWLARSAKGALLLLLSTTCFPCLALGFVGPPCHNSTQSTGCSGPDV